MTESGAINNWINEYLITTCGMPIFNCVDGPMDIVTVRTGCIQVEPNSIVTLQVELNPDSSMYTADNELYRLSYTISSLMGSDTSDNRLRFNLNNILTTHPPETNLTTLNSIGIYFDHFSVNVAYEQCINSSHVPAQLSGSIAIFSCYTI